MVEDETRREEPAGPANLVTDELVEFGEFIGWNSTRHEMFLIILVEFGECTSDSWSNTERCQPHENLLIILEEFGEYTSDWWSKTERRQPQENLLMILEEFGEYLKVMK